ncbi:MAG: M48 family metalloprotease [Magnetospirillum sp.]|nr:M48 family metalloprotease [Magnetospirillum sp.]
MLAAFPNGTFSAEALKILFMGYKRENEFEADERVFTIFDRTGYDPRQTSPFFRQLIKIYPQTRAETTSLYSTHPGTLERIRRMEDLAASLPRPRTEPPSPGWSELKRLFPTPPDLRTSQCPIFPPPPAIPISP